MKFFWSLILGTVKIRSRVIHYLVNYYFHELKFSIPVGNNYWANLLENDSFDSFSEIFINREYGNYIPSIPINRVLDLGANYGYFSLWIQSIRPKDKILSKLIEPSVRCKKSLEKLVNDHENFEYIQLAVGNPHVKEAKFFDRPFMAGSLFDSSNEENFYHTNILKTTDCFSKDIQSYDLIKCDIEGAEWELLNNYTSLLKNSKYIVMEWHSWHSGGGGFQQIKQKLNDMGFKIIRSNTPQNAVGRVGEVGLFLAKNLNFQS